MIGASNLAGFQAINALAFREAIRIALNGSNPRPFAAFRGDFRRPVKRGGKVRKGKVPLASADMRRLFAASIVPDRTSNIAKLQRGLRIIERCKAAADDKL